MSITYYTEKEYNDLDKEKSFFLGLVQNVLRNEETHQRATRRTECEKKSQWFYIPNSNIMTVFSTLKRVYDDFLRHSKRKDPSGNYHRPKMLELGSGLGIISRMGYNLGYKATGIEIDDDLLEKSNKMFGNTDYCSLINFVKGDAMKQATRIKNSDLIYFYSPFTRAKAKQFLQYVIKHSTKGTYLYMVCHCDEEYKEIEVQIKKGTIARVPKKDGDMSYQSLSLYIKTSESNVGSKENKRGKK